METTSMEIAGDGMATPNADMLQSAHGQRRTCFFTGTATHSVYVDHLPAADDRPARLPIVMVHGGFHTGAAWLSTPDGRAGWATYFANLGHDVYVADWPGHGRSPGDAEFSRLSTRDIAAALAVLVAEVGPAIVFAHSAGGPIAWWIAEALPDKVAAIVGVAPGPPANIQPVLPDDPEAVNALRFDQAAGCPVYSELDKPVFVGLEFIRNYWANAARFPERAIGAYARSIVAESAMVLNERFNIGNKGLKLKDPSVVGARPILVITGDNDPRHPRAADEAVAR